MPNYTPENTFGLDIQVRLDGELLKDVVEADTDEGYVIQLVRGPNGNVAFDPVTEGPKKEKLEGDVTVDARPINERKSDGT